MNFWIFESVRSTYLRPEEAHLDVAQPRVPAVGDDKGEALLRRQVLVGSVHVVEGGDDQKIAQAELAVESLEHEEQRIEDQSLSSNTMCSDHVMAMRRFF